MENQKKTELEHKFLCDITIYHGGKSRTARGFGIASNEPLSSSKKLNSILDFVFTDMLNIKEPFYYHNEGKKFDVFETKKIYGDWFIVIRDKRDSENPIFIQINKVAQ